MEFVQHSLKEIREFLNVQLFKLGGSEVTLWVLLYLLVFLFLLIYLSGKLKKWLVESTFLTGAIDFRVRQAIGSILRYFIVAIGVLIILQTAGINLTTLQVFAGTIGIGVGFGLQNIASNFVSGLIILFERPISIGDRIEVGKVEGDVIAINPRSTTVVTNDNISIIIPNSKFITENVINWTLTGENVRFRIPLTIPEWGDLRKVEDLLMNLARKNRDVLDNPPPAVRVLGFSGSGIQVELRVWSTTLTHRKATLISSLNYAIYDAFKEHGITLLGQTPQYDVHILKDE